MSRIHHTLIRPSSYHSECTSEYGVKAIFAVCRKPERTIDIEVKLTVAISLAQLDIVITIAIMGS